MNTPLAPPLSLQPANAVRFRVKAVLALLYGREYGEYGVVLVWMMVAAALAYVASALSYGLTAARGLGVQAVIQVACVAVCVVLSVFLVGRVGLVGAAWSLGGAYCAGKSVAMGAAPLPSTVGGVERWAGCVSIRQSDPCRIE